MKTDLHDLLDQPLVGEPTLRPPHEHLQRSRSMMRRRRLLRSGLAASSAAAVIAITLSSGSLGSASAGKDATDGDLVATEPPPQSAPSSAISAEVRERFPRQARIVDCLVAKGYNVTLGRDGGVGYEIATSGADAYYAAEDVCTKEVEGDQPPRSLDQLTPREWHSLYPQEQTTAACLRKHAVEVPALPPFRSYVTKYKSKHPWTAYGFVPETGQSRSMKLNWDCPQPRVGS